MMTLEEFLPILSANPGVNLQFLLPDRTAVPAHFHVTEVGRMQKDFIDCGGTTRRSESCVLQVWVAHDIEHRLETTKLARIIYKGLDLFETTAIPLEVEYDNGVISQYPVQDVEVQPSGIILRLGTKHTACLAPDRCGIDLTAMEQNPTSSCCAPGCC